MTAPRMTRPEAVTLCRLAKAACPQQAFDEYTPDAWFELLSDLRFDECKEALFKVAREQPFCSPAEIRKAVRSVRSDRLARFGAMPTPPFELNGDPRAEVEWAKAIRQRVADGELTREQWNAQEAELTQRFMPALESTFRHVDEESA